jgi:uncharacterized protein involved in outer membrane biogenesis
MRKSLFILGVIVGVIAVAVGLVLSNLNAYLTSHKDWLTAQVEGVLGRKVSFSEISVSLSSGFGARVKDVRIADDPTFSAEDFVRAGDVEVSVKMWPALFRRFEVTRIVLDKPDVRIIRTRNGRNYDSIGGGVLKVEICFLRKSTSFCFQSGKTSGFYRHLHF